MDLKIMVTEIKHLPNTLMKESGIDLNDISDNNEFDKAIVHLKSQYRHISDWLKYYLLNIHVLHYELINNKTAGIYKPLAERTVAIYNFAQEIYLLSDLLHCGELNPSLLTFLIEREICLTTLKNSGISAKPTFKGKRSTYDETIKMCKSFDLDKLKLNGNKKIETFSELMINEAIKICQHKENYQFREKYNKYIREIKKCDRLIWKNNDIHFGYLKKDKLITNSTGLRK